MNESKNYVFYGVFLDTRLPKCVARFNSRAKARTHCRKLNLRAFELFGTIEPLYYVERVNPSKGDKCE